MAGLHDSVRQRRRVRLVRRAGLDQEFLDAPLRVVVQHCAERGVQDRRVDQVLQAAGGAALGGGAGDEVGYGGEFVGAQGWGDEVYGCYVFEERGGRRGVREVGLDDFGGGVVGGEALRGGGGVAVKAEAAEGFGQVGEEVGTLFA